MSIYTRYRAAGRRLIAEAQEPEKTAIAPLVHRLEECLSQISTYGGSDQERARLAAVVAELDRVCMTLPEVHSTFQEYSRGAVSTGTASAASDKPATTVLIAQAAPDGLLGLRQAEEFSAIEQELAAGQRARFDVVYCHAAKIERLAGLIRSRRPAVLHVSGHGTADGTLMLHGEDGAADAVTISAVAAARPRSGAPRLVVLNACWSDAQALSICSISPCAIGIRERWDDSCAVLFARELYRHLADGATVGPAFRSAVSALAVHDPDAARLPELRTARGVDPDTVAVWMPDAS